MALGTVLLGTLLVGGGLAGGALATRAMMRRKALPPLDEDIQIIEEDYDPWDYVDIERAMPTAADFPGGWDVVDEGKDSSGRWAMAWRLLLLKDPPAADGTQLVSVVSAKAPGYSQDGWGTATSQEQAMEQISFFRRQASSAGTG